MSPTRLSWLCIPAPTFRPLSSPMMNLFMHHNGMHYGSLQYVTMVSQQCSLMISIVILVISQFDHSCIYKVPCLKHGVFLVITYQFHIFCMGRSPTCGHMNVWYCDMLVLSVWCCGCILAGVLMFWSGLWWLSSVQHSSNVFQIFMVFSIWSRFFRYS